MNSKIASYKPFSVKRVGILATILIIGTFSLLGIYIISTNSNVTEHSDLPKVVIRVDDIQDFAFKEAQLFILNQSIKNKIPSSLAIIAEVFGMDTELVETTIKAIGSGCEIDVHGWEHENLTLYGFNEQKMRLLQAKKYLEKTLNTETEVLVPPMFSYNNNTIKAMEETGYTIVSGLTEFHETGWASDKIRSVPATIELSDYGNETWQMKSKSLILKEVEASVEAYGYAMIVTHPQEFMKDDGLNQEFANEFKEILQDLFENFSFSTIEGLSKSK